MQKSLKKSPEKVQENLKPTNENLNPSNNEAFKTSASATASVSEVFIKEISNQKFQIQNKNFTKEREIFISRKIRWGIFTVLLILQIMMNVDHGTVPAALEEIRKDLQIQDDLLGIFASLVFLGNLIGSLLSLVVINRVSRKFLLALSLFLNSVCLFTYAIINIKWILFANRIFVGIFQAYIAIYLPVWCDQFGMRNKKSIMISMIQVGSMVGVVLGYFMTFDIKKRSEWTFSFTLQSLVIFILFLIISVIPSIYFTADLTARKKQEEIDPNFTESSSQSLNGSVNANLNESLTENLTRNNSKNTFGSNLPDYNNFNKNDLDSRLQENPAHPEISRSDYDDCIFIYNRLHENQESHFKSNTNTNNKKIITTINDSHSSSDNNNTNNNIINQQDQWNTVNDEREIKTNTVKEFFNNIRIIFSEKVFVFSTIALSTLFFVITAVQYWITTYMQEVLKIEDTQTILFIFTIICVTAPTLGLIMGGAACTYIGGYETKHSILLCFLFAFCAGPFSILVPFANTLIPFAIFLWLVIFFGSAIFPTLTGIILSSLPVELRGLGYSINSFFANLFGYIPAPYVYGLINYMYKRENQRMAFTSIMTYPILCLVWISLATYFRYKKFDRKSYSDMDSAMSGNDTKNSECSISVKTNLKEMELIDLQSNNFSEMKEINANNLLSPSINHKENMNDEIEVNKFRKNSDMPFSKI